jgi:hypothetical protein
MANHAYKGDGFGNSVFRLLVPTNNQWHQLPSQLSDGLDVLANHAQVDAYNDPDASFVPLAHVGRIHLLHGMIQSAAGIPLAHYHMAGSRRVWIAVPNRHRANLSRAIPSKCSPPLAIICSSSFRYNPPLFLAAWTAIHWTGLSTRP